MTSQIQKILWKDFTVYLFGSQARGDATVYSDWDFAIQWSTKIPRLLRRELREFQDEVPRNIDIVDLHDISENFKTVIQPDMVQLV